MLRYPNRSTASLLYIAALAALPACGGTRAASPGGDPAGAIQRSRELRLAADWDGAAAVLAEALKTAPPASRAGLLVARAAVEREVNAYRRSDDGATAQATLAEAEPLIAAAGAEERAAYAEERAWITYSRAFKGAAKFDDARPGFEEARTLREPLGASGALAMAWFEIGLTHQQSERLEEARTAFRRGHEVSLQAKDLVSQGYLERHLGYVEAELAKAPKLGLPYYARSLDVRDRSGHRWGAVFARLLLADMVREAGEPNAAATARAHYEQAATDARALRVTRGLGAALEGLAALDAAEGGAAKSCERLAEAARAWGEYGDAEARAKAEETRGKQGCP